jgi:hypothetical protein
MTGASLRRARAESRPGWTTRPCAAPRSRPALWTHTAFHVRSTCNGLVYDATAGVDGRVHRGRPRLGRRTLGHDRWSLGAVVAHRPAGPVHQDPGGPQTSRRWHAPPALPAGLRNPRWPRLRDAQHTRLARPPATARCWLGVATARPSQANGKRSPACPRASPRTGDRPAPRRRQRARRPAPPAPLSAAR